MKTEKDIREMLAILEWFGVQPDAQDALKWVLGEYKAAVLCDTAAQEPQPVAPSRHSVRS